MDDVTSLSPEVSNSMKHRYLLPHVYETARNDKQAFSRMYEVLLLFPSTPASTDDCSLISIEHLSDLVQILASYASKWRLIGSALRFQPQELDTIQQNRGWMPDSSKKCLLILLRTWIKGNKHILPPTVKSLDQALNSELVGLGALVCKVNSVILRSDRRTIQYEKLPYLISSITFTCIEQNEGSHCQNVSHIEANENESILLEIQATAENEEIESLEYRWEATRYELSTPSASTHILCTKVKDIDMDGCQYSCKITCCTKKPQPTFWPLNSLRWDTETKLSSSTVQTESVTLHVRCSLDSARNDLISVYLAQPEVPKDTWPPISNKKYINLALIKQETVDFMKKITQLTVRGDIDDILKDKEVIEYKELIKNLKSEDVLLIEGRPGSGKTTFVHKITHDWATSPQEYSRTIRSLFLVSLRVLSTLKKPRLELSDILQLFSGVKVSQELLEEREGKGVCFVFDGLDEFSPHDGEESIVYRIINKEYLSKSIVIVASRPAATAHLRSRATKVVEVVGFLKDQIFEYFSHYPFSETTKPAELNKYLLSHPNILHICYLPIHAVMVAFLFEVTGEVPRTETEIYKHFTNFTIIRNLSKCSEANYSIESIQSLGKKEKYVFEQVCRLAYEKTILNKQAMNQDEVNFTVGKEGMSLGLVTVDRTAGLYKIMNVYTFLHLTFQEYLAAFHISILNYEEQFKLIEEHGSKNHMLVVWKFFCGLVQFDTSVSDSRFPTLLQKTENKHLFQIQCAYESQQVNACTQFLKKVKYHIELKDKYMHIPDFTAVGYVTSHSVIPAKLTISDCKINVDVMNALAAEINENENLIHKLKVARTIDNYEIAMAFSDVLKHCINLKELDISHNEIDDKKAEILAVGLQHCKSLEKLLCTNNKMTPMGVSAIFESFLLRRKPLTGRTDAECILTFLSNCTTCSLQSSLSFSKQSINLIGECKKNYITASSPTLVAALHFSDVHKLQKLVLTGGVMQTIDNAKYVAFGVSHCNCLQVLDFSDNDCEDHVVQAFFNHLKSIKSHEDDHSSKVECRLQRVNLCNNQTSKDGAKSLALCLGTYYPDLLALDLDDNKIGASGVIAILKNLRKLEELHLRNNRIGSDGAKAVASYLQRHRHLHTLSLTNCEIGRNGISSKFPSVSYNAKN